MTSQYGFLLDHLAGSTPGVVHALLVSDDGLRQAISSRLDVGLADQLSAMTSGLMSLANGGGRLLNGATVANVAITYHGYHLILMSTGGNSHLAVLAGGDAELGAIAYAMADLVRRLAENAQVPVRMPEPNGAY